MAPPRAVLPALALLAVAACAPPLLVARGAGAARVLGEGGAEAGVEHGAGARRLAEADAAAFREHDEGMGLGLATGAREERAPSGERYSGLAGNSEIKIVNTPLPECSVVVLHHLEKTGGTTLRALMQRQSQWGEWDFFSYAPSTGRDIMWYAFLARVRAAAEAPAEENALKDFRMLVEVHGKGAEQSIATRVLPDVLGLKELLRGRCDVKIVSMVRDPVDLYLSWHQHWVAGSVPLCMWEPLPNIQTRMIVGADHFWRAGGDLTHESGIQSFHEEGSEYMQRLALGVLSMYDFVGVMEKFDESVLLLADEIGLQHVGYVATNVRHGAGSLTKNDKRSYVAPDKDVSDEARADLQFQRAVNLQSKTSREVDAVQRRYAKDQKMTPAMIAAVRRNACNQHGCLPALRDRAGNWSMDMCVQPQPFVVIDGNSPEGEHGLLPDVEVTPERKEEANAIMDRIRNAVKLDTKIYAAASRVFQKRLEAAGPDMAIRVAALREQSAAMAAAMDAQMEEPSVKCKHTSLNCIGTDEYCVGCLSDHGEWHTVFGCWPDHPWKYRPAARQYTCERTWAYGGALIWNIPNKEKQNGLETSEALMPCWQSCWTRTPGMPGGVVGEQVCMSKCPDTPRTLKESAEWVLSRREQFQGWKDAAALHDAEQGWVLE